MHFGFRFWVTQSKPSIGILGHPNHSSSEKGIFQESSQFLSLHQGLGQGEGWESENKIFADFALSFFFVCVHIYPSGTFEEKNCRGHSRTQVLLCTILLSPYQLSTQPPPGKSSLPSLPLSPYTPETVCSLSSVKAQFSSYQLCEAS